MLVTLYETTKHSTEPGSFTSPWMLPSFLLAS